MKISVRNYRRLERADIECALIALVAGLNGAGKTSLVQAVQAALTQQPLTLAGVAKKDAKLLVHRGADQGSVRIEHEEGSLDVTWPKCILLPEPKDAGPLASPYAAGLRSFLDLADKERATALSAYIDAQPTRADLVAALLDAGYTEEGADRTWKAIGKSGWDFVHNHAKEHGAKLKGLWEQTTGEAYGAQKAAHWSPQRWEEGWDESELRRHRQACADGVDEALRSQGKGIAEAEQLAATVKAAEGLDLDALEKALAEAAEAEKKAVERLDECPLPPGLGMTVRCPHEKCGRESQANITIRNGAVHSITLTPPGVDPVTPQAKDMRRAHQEATFAKEQAERKRKAAERALDEAKPKVEAANEAAEKLAKLPDQAAAVKAIEEARAALAEAEADLKAFNDRKFADQQHAHIVKNQKLIELLAPDGLRKRKLASGLEKFNAGLAELCKAAKWPAVTLDESLHAYCDGYPHLLLAESHQLRVRIVLQVAAAVLDGSDMVVIDRADMLDVHGRNGLFALLRHAKLKALVTMTVNKPELVADLDRAKLGRSYWLRDGVAAPRAEAIEPKKEAA